LPIGLRGILVVAATIVAALACRAILQRIVPRERIEEAEWVGDMVMEALAALYGVLVAFLLAGAWDRLDDARNAVAIEVNALSDLRQIAAMFPPPTSTQLAVAVERYHTRAIEELLNERTTRETSMLPAIVAEIFRTVAMFEPRTPAETQLQVLALDAVKDLADQRRTRTYTSQPLPHLVWWILIGGAAAIIVVVAISSSARLGLIYLLLLAGVISLALFSIYALTYPVRAGLIEAAMRRP